MLISISFSIVTYRILTLELDRVERVQRLRFERDLLNPDIFSPRPVIIFDPDIIENSKNHLKLILVIINACIFGSSAIAGYFLAGRTLKPIQIMVNEQNRFITDASHELRTPLTSLKTEIEVNLRDKKLTLKDAKNILKSNLEEVNNLQMLSDNLIKLTQYEGGISDIQFNQLPLISIIEESIRKVSPLADAKNIKIITKTDRSFVYGNKQLLVELFIIFLDNAIKYSHLNSMISVSSYKKDGHTLVKISDEGVGIDPKDLPNIFDRFYRTDKSRSKSDTPGYGLGLSIAKQIIEKHHGAVSVKSIPGTGTTFHISLPTKQQSLLT